MPTAEDADALVTNRDYATGNAVAGLVEMRAGAMVNALRGVDTEEIAEADARVLITQAAQRHGGRAEIEHKTGGFRVGGPKITSEYRVWMPSDAFQ
jgi:hypothetical protein